VGDDSQVKSRSKNPATEIEAFGKAIGISMDAWPANEEPEQITLDGVSIEKENMINLNWDLISALMESYGSAFFAEFTLGEVAKLAIDEVLTKDDFIRFIEDFKKKPSSMKLNLKLDKAVLANNWIGDLPFCKTYLYLYPCSLERRINCTLRELESLWPDDSRKIALIVPGREIDIIGPGIIVKGGKYLNEWLDKKDESSLQQPDWKKIKEIQRAHRENLKRDDPKLDFLTPMHLELKKVEQPDDLITKALLIHLINSFLIYTADATTGSDDNPIRAIYAGSNACADIILAKQPEDLEISLKECGALIAIFNWAYAESQWVNDRLPFLQVAVVQALKTDGKRVRVKSLLQNASSIWNGLDWEWKSFIDGEIESYVTGVKDLEDYIDQTAKAYSDEISSMIKGLVDTMLAAVGVLIGSFIGSLLGKDFSPSIFKIGMWSYATYVLVFPFLYSMFYQLQRYFELRYGFNLRIESFKRKLLEDKVSSVIGKRVQYCQISFILWFALIALTYIAVIAFALMAADRVPMLINSNSTLSNMNSVQLIGSIVQNLGSYLIQAGSL
jgi:hypothetical protein